MDPVHSILPHLPFNPQLASIITAAAACSLGIFYFFIFSGKRVATNATWYAFTEDALRNHVKAREQWITNAQDILRGGLKKVRGAIAVISPTGPLVFLPNSYAHEIRNMKEFSFGRSIAVDMSAHSKGLTPFLLLDYHEITQEVVRVNLTRSLDLITDEMNAEVEDALMDILGNVPDWKPIELKSMIYQLIARLSTRIFLSQDFSKNPEWLDIAISYTANSLGAVRKLHKIHPLLHPIAHWWIPEVKICRQQVAKARKLIDPLVRDRLQRKANGESTKKTADMFSWVDDNAKAKGVKIDFAEVQLLLAFVALHTTTETMSWLMCDLLENEEWIPRLREEMISALSNNGRGWKKTTLASMELLDSAMKESQRLNPINEIPMQRVLLHNVTLSDGTIIPKGYRASVEDRFKDPVLYPNADKFVADRFVKLRATNRNKWHFVTGSPEHLGFGYGNHTCPGRFFASNEIKVVMTYFLIKYDWKFTEEGRLPTCNAGSEHFFDGRQKVLVKTRLPEINISSL